MFVKFWLFYMKIMHCKWIVNKEKHFALSMKLCNVVSTLCVSFYLYVLVVRLFYNMIQLHVVIQVNVRLNDNDSLNLDPSFVYFYQCNFFLWMSLKYLSVFTHGVSNVARRWLTQVNRAYMFLHRPYTIKNVSVDAVYMKSGANYFIFCLKAKYSDLKR